MFKGHCFPKVVILLADYYKLRFSLSYRDIEKLLKITGVIVETRAESNPQASYGADVISRLNFTGSFFLTTKPKLTL